MGRVPPDHRREEELVACVMTSFTTLPMSDDDLAQFPPQRMARQDAEIAQMSAMTAPIGQRRTSAARARCNPWLIQARMNAMSLVPKQRACVAESRPWRVAASSRPKSMSSGRG
jgi:hypothetical protein